MELVVPLKLECKEVAVGHKSVRTQEESTQTKPEILEWPMAFEEELESLPVIPPPPECSIEGAIRTITYNEECEKV